jgi:hypothetical protein
MNSLPSSSPSSCHGLTPTEYITKYCKRLVDVQLKSCKISHPDLSSSDDIRILVDALRQTPTLRKLDVVGCSKLGNANNNSAVDVLCEALKETNVSHFSLECTRPIGYKGLQSLTQLLQHRERMGNPIKALGLEGSIFRYQDDDEGGDDDDDDAFVQTDGTNMKVWTDFCSVACHTLESLDLCKNNLSSTHIQFLAKEITACSNNKTPCKLLALLLSGNPIGDTGMKFLCQGLKRNKSLILLACGDCELSTKSAYLLTDALRSNATLQRLYMYGNELNTGEDEWRYWLDLNINGRSLLQNQNCRSEYVPFILSRVSNQPQVIHGLLMQSPCHTWTG